LKISLSRHFVPDPCQHRAGYFSFIISPVEAAK
jgi:hypothetical protein